MAEDYADIVFEGIRKLDNSQQNAAYDKMNAEQVVPDRIIRESLDAMGVDIDD